MNTPIGHRDNEPIEPLMSLKEDNAGDGSSQNSFRGSFRGFRGIRDRRGWALLSLIFCLSILFTAGSLKPHTKGMGTHQLLGLRACEFEVSYNMPCPTCGMTTSFAHAARGNLLRSFLVQPAGMVLALLTAMGAIVSVYVLYTGSAIVTLVWSMLSTAQLFKGLLILFAVGWAYTLVIHTLLT